jgi:hypothetical protein
MEMDECIVSLYECDLIRNACIEKDKINLKSVATATKPYK